MAADSIQNKNIYLTKKSKVTSTEDELKRCFKFSKSLSASPRRLNNNHLREGL